MTPRTIATILFAILLAVVAKPDGGHAPIIVTVTHTP